MIDLNGLLPLTSTTNSRNDNQSFKRSLSKTSTRKSLEKATKRFCNNSSSSENHGNKETIILLKSLSLSFTDVAKDVYQSSKDIKIWWYLWTNLIKSLILCMKIKRKCREHYRKKR